MNMKLTLGDVLETRVAHCASALLASRKTVAFAESCTGGLVTHALSRYAGVSQALLGGIVAYANPWKEKYLSVDAAVIHEYGAVSREAAIAMADGLARASGADYAIAITGIAGPAGGTSDKPVGTVWVAMATAPEAGIARHFMFVGDRHEIQYQAAEAALAMLEDQLAD